MYHGELIAENKEPVSVTLLFTDEVNSNGHIFEVLGCYYMVYNEEC